MGNTGSVEANRVESTDLRQSLSVCLACHKNLFHEKYTERTTEIKMHVKRFLQSVYNTNEATVFDWVTWDRDTADIVVPDDATWVEDGGVLVPLHLQGLRDAFDVVVSVFCPTMVLPSRDVAFAYKLLKPNGLFVVMGSGSPEAFLQNVVSARARTGVIPPIESQCPSTPVPIYYHQGTRSNGIDSFGVFQKVVLATLVSNPSQKEQMENVVVEPGNGDVGVSTLIKAAMPKLHPGSLLRSVHNVLKKSDAVGIEMTTKTVNGRTTRMASLEVCNYILDNMPGAHWTMWRTSNGDSFKESLAQRVNQARESCPKEVHREVHQGEEEVQEELQEAKESTMKKALRNLGIDGSVRVDEASGKASIIDVIKLLSPGVSHDSARKNLTRLLEKGHDRAIPISSRVSHIKVNRKGHTTPCTDFKTIVEIIWVLPTSASRDFRRKSAKTICRVMGGDVELCREIEENHAKWRAMDGGGVIQQRLLQPVEYKENDVSQETPAEFAVRDDLAFFLQGKTEVKTPSGFIDVLTDNEVIEVKYYRNWKGGMGQVLAYGSYFPLRRKRLHLFAHTRDADMAHHFHLAKSVCSKYGVHVTHEQVVGMDFFKDDIVSRKRKVYELA